jgi:hypothetical protein
MLPLLGPHTQVDAPLVPLPVVLEVVGGALGLGELLTVGDLEDPVVVQVAGVRIAGAAVVDQVIRQLLGRDRAIVVDVVTGVEIRRVGQGVDGVDQTVVVAGLASVTAVRRLRVSSDSAETVAPGRRLPSSASTVTVIVPFCA